MHALLPVNKSTVKTTFQSEEVNNVLVKPFANLYFLFMSKVWKKCSREIILSGILV